VQIDQPALDREKEFELAGQRFVIFVVAYNAETTINKALLGAANSVPGKPNRTRLNGH
jgi:hypothetical protein